MSNNSKKIDTIKIDIIIDEFTKLMEINEWTPDDLKNALTKLRKHISIKKATNKYYEKNKEEIIKRNYEYLKIYRNKKREEYKE